MLDIKNCAIITLIEYQTLKMENNIENENSLNLAETTENTEEVVDLGSEQETETLSAEELKALREKASKADELEDKNKKLYARLKKEPKIEEKIDSSITARDVLILSGAGVTNEEDIEVVEKWAKFNGTSIRDALNDSTLKTVLATKQEERRTALATSSKGGARGTSTPSIEVILSDASKGKLPENDSEIAKLAEARMLKRLEGK